MEKIIHEVLKSFKKANLENNLRYFEDHIPVMDSYRSKLPDGEIVHFQVDPNIFIDFYNTKTIKMIELRQRNRLEDFGDPSKLNEIKKAMDKVLQLQKVH